MTQFVKVLLTGKEKEWDELRVSLTVLAKNPKEVPDDEVRALCDQIAIRGSETKGSVALCEKQKLGYSLESKLVPRDWILTSHLNKRWDKDKLHEVQVFGMHRLDVYSKLISRGGTSWTLQAR